MEKMYRLSGNFLGKENVMTRRIKYNKNAELHSHEFYEIELTLSGNGKQILNGKSYDMKRGSITFITPADFHEYACHSEIEIMGVYFTEKLLSKNMLDKIFDKNYSSYINLTEEKTMDALRLLENISSATLYDDYIKEVLIKKLIECLFITVTSCPDEIAEREEKATISVAKRYIELHFRDNPSLKDVAEAVGKTPEYFCKYFYKNEGIYYTDYLNMQRLKCAVFLLRESNMTVTEIGYEAGFSSMSNFLRVFKEKEGMTPSEYRKKQKS